MDTAALLPAQKTITVLDVADWRRRVAALYHTVRAQSYGKVAWIMWTTKREQLFLEHPGSPVVDDPVAPRYFDYNPAFRFTVEVEEATGDAQEIELGDDGRITFVPALKTKGLKDPLGAELTIFWISAYGGGLFLPFKDATNGGDTFGGGRYLIDSIKGADFGAKQGKDNKGRMVLDFNFAYNPSCSYSSRWVCPLSPPENTLSEPVRAGELAPLH